MIFAESSLHNSSRMGIEKIEHYMASSADEDIISQLMSPGSRFGDPKLNMVIRESPLSKHERASKMLSSLSIRKSPV